MEKMELWNKVARPPVDALKQIKGGRLSGMTDINPQWRYRALTENFGPCGVGWKYIVDKKWLEPGADGNICAFADISLHIKVEGEWSDAIPGSGGSMFVAKEKSGLHTSDECYKMAITDALSVAAKALGLGADIYAGRWDGSKYKDVTPEPEKKEAPDQYEKYKALIDKCSTVQELEAFKTANQKKLDALPMETKTKLKDHYLGVMFILKKDEEGGA